MKFFGKQNIRIIRFGAAYDFIAALGFLPPFAGSTLANLSHLQHTLGLPGTLPSFAPEQLLFANLMAVVILLWATLRFVKPLPYYGFVDALGRLAYILTMLYYLLTFHISAVLWGFAFLEAFWGTVQTLGYLGHRAQMAP